MSSKATISELQKSTMADQPRQMIGSACIKSTDRDCSVQYGRRVSFVGIVQVKHEHLSPSPSHKIWRARGKDWRGGGVEWLRILRREVESLRGSPDRILLPGPGPRDAASHHRQRVFRFESRDELSIEPAGESIRQAQALAVSMYGEAVLVLGERG